MLACFHSLGSLPVVRDVLKIIDNGILMQSANSFKTLGCMPSGPGDLNVFSFFSFAATTDGLIVYVSTVL